MEPFERGHELCQTKAAEKSINLHIGIEKNIPKYATGDIYKLKQVLTNLLSNAIKFTPIHGEINIKLSMYKKTNLKIEVIDTGIGIDEKTFHVYFIRLSKKTYLPQENFEERV